MTEIKEIVCYIISTHYGTYYCGITNSLIRRWKEHVNKESKYLSIYSPKEVVYIEVYESYDTARKREIQIKQNGVGKFYKNWKIQSGYYNDTKHQR